MTGFQKILVGIAGLFFVLFHLSFLYVSVMSTYVKLRPGIDGMPILIQPVQPLPKNTAPQIPEVIPNDPQPPERRYPVIEVVSNDIVFNTSLTETTKQGFMCQPENAAFIPVSKFPEAGCTRDTIQKSFGNTSATITAFGQASSAVYLLDLKNSTQKTRRIPYVHFYTVSEEGDLLFVFFAENKQGVYTNKRMIIDTQTLENVGQIPYTMCSNFYDGFRWSNGRLITYAEQELPSDDGDYRTNVCVWNPSGQLFYSLKADLTWHAAAGSYLYDQIGVLPSQPGVFYLYTGNTEIQGDEKTLGCRLLFQELSGSKRTRSFQVVPYESATTTDGYFDCPEVQFDFSRATFESKTVSFQKIISYERGNAFEAGEPVLGKRESAVLSD